MVNEYCTCGAKLPEGARFCHKCGRPLFPLPEVEAEPSVQGPLEPPLVPSPQPPARTSVGFRNPGAVRVGMLVASAISLLFFVPVPPLFAPLWQLILVVTGGFLAVYLYHRRTGDVLSTRTGARLGWMTGLFTFLIFMVLFTLSLMALAGGGSLQEAFREVANASSRPELSAQFDALLQSPAGVAGLLFGMLLLFFFLLTTLASLGGALAAKVLEKD